MRARLLLWPAVVALLVLTARWLAYELAPSPLARVLEQSAGGPSLVIVTLVSLGLTLLGSVLVVWLAAVGVRERARLQPERVAPSLRLRRLGLRAVGLYLASSLAFALFESYLHWRAGIGFHGLSCLVGPCTGTRSRCSPRSRSPRPRWPRRSSTCSPGCGPSSASCGDAGSRRSASSPSPHSSRSRRRSSRCSAVRGVRRSRPDPDLANERRPMRFVLAAAGAAVLTLVLAGAASAHAIMSPPVAKSKVDQQFTLSVPTEEEGATTTEIELTVPDGFSIDSFEPSPGWKREESATGSGEERVIQKVTWSGGKVPTDEDAVFRFNGSMDSDKTYTFQVRQTYSNGKVVDWSGSGELRHAGADDRGGLRPRRRLELDADDRRADRRRGSASCSGSSGWRREAGP